MTLISQDLGVFSIIAVFHLPRIVLNISNILILINFLSQYG